MPKITVNGKDYDNFNDLPPEFREKIQKNLGKIKNIPFAKGLLKMYGMDINNLSALGGGGSSGEMPSGNSDLSSLGNNQFGGSQFSGNQFGGPTGPSGPSGSPMGQFNNPFFNKKSGGGIAVVVTMILILGGVAGLIFAITSMTSSWEETFDLQGDPSRFDPFAAVNEMRSHIDPNAKLGKININYVRADGTMDLTAKFRPTADYDFYRELAEPPKDAPPVGAGGTTTGKWYEPVQAEVYVPGQWRHVTRMGGGMNTEYSYVNKGIDLDRDPPTTNPSEFLEDPKCKIADFWKIALRKGAPADAVARVEYNTRGYDFRISDAGINLEFDENCKLKED